MLFTHAGARFLYESYHNVSHAVGSPKTPAQTTLRSTALAFGVYISSAAYWKPYAEDGHGREAIVR